MPFKNPHPLYQTWQGMHQRCRNPNSRQWNDYGGRGIKVCERWSNFHTFASDMGPKPPGYSLDRIDNDGDYSPDNCRWASRRDQQLNQRRAVYVEVDGKRYRAIELARLAGVKSDTIIERAKRGLPYEMVISSEKLMDTSGLALGGAANGRRQKAKTHCPQGHPYTPDNLRANKNGYRACLTCHRERARRKAASKA